MALRVAIGFATSGSGSILHWLCVPTVMISMLELEALGSLPQLTLRSYGPVLSRDVLNYRHNQPQPIRRVA